MTFFQLGHTAARTNSHRFLGHPTHSHEVPQLVFIVNGTGRLSAGGRTMLLHKHQSVWLAAGVSHSLTLSDDGAAVGPFLSPSAVPPDGQLRVLAATRALSDLIMVLLVAAPETEEEWQPFHAALSQTVTMMVHEYFPLRLPSHPVAHAVALEAAQFQGTLGDLAQQHYTSVRHLQRLFTDETGLGFARWRTRARLNIAVAHLRTGATMRTAMLESGFATRQGLLKALSREADIPLPQLLANADAPLELLGTCA